MILGIETSCDETAAALVSDEGTVLSSIVSSQANLHAKYGGVVPEVASRHHLELVLPVVRESLTEADASLDDVNVVAVTQGPGLVGALLVGLSAAKAIAWSRGLPLVPVDHLEGHVASLYLGPDAVEPPFLCLLASGGHTLLLAVREHGRSERLGTTLDDAAGEAFDKGARLLGLGYPGGAALDRLAQDGDPGAFRFPSRACPASTSRSRVSRPRCCTRCVISARTRSPAGGPTSPPPTRRRSCGRSWVGRARPPSSTGLEQIAVVGGVAANSGLRAALPDAQLRAPRAVHGQCRDDRVGRPLCGTTLRPRLPRARRLCLASRRTRALAALAVAARGRSPRVPRRRRSRRSTKLAGRACSAFAPTSRRLSAMW